ncbi:hypothetical protein RHGRI_024859 [Rhododendron griersonianum]|uniref:Fatty acid desaturase domain-containing protein n=1 Tax=Rhododendron griersonianum TaxID=479676 RepID=A0AAV6J8M9_9ERIC|nr:hypothetical protein RHGRI_024859 [Rhododendron griersonianum]
MALMISPPPNAKPYSVSQPPRATVQTTVYLPRIYFHRSFHHSVKKGNLVHTIPCSGNRALPVASATPLAAAETVPESNFRRIALSDVVVKRRRNVYWGRKWNSRDVVTASVVVLMHLLCFLAPFNFNWGAFWVAVGLYVVTGLLVWKHQQCGGFREAALLQGVRIVWVYHITWLVNSACHVWGKQAWNTGDLSRNNWWVALLAFGEGWHNNHHAFEYSARHGLEWWQIDMTWYAVRFFQAIGLATDVKLPTEAQKERMAFSNGKHFHLN